MRHRLVLAAVLASLSGCVEGLPVPEAHEQKPFDALKFSCTTPYRVARDFGDHRGPCREITLNDQQFLTGGTEDGKIVVIAGGHYLRDSAATPLTMNQPLVTHAANDAVQAITTLLVSKGARTTNVQPIGNKRTTYAYVLEHDSDGYKWLLELPSSKVPNRPLERSRPQ